MAGFSWIDLPVVDADDEPIHESGIVPRETGLYFVGLHFLHALSSTMIHGIARDAKRVVDTIAVRVQASSPLPTSAASAGAAHPRAAAGVAGR
jgi:putative flavoprotein involved in K+ transport